jgi:hypothetical protein
MSTLPIASSSNASTLQALFQQRKSEFKSMASDVEAGNMSAAQSALATLQQTASNIQGLGGTSAPPSTAQTGSLQSSFANLISSIQSGSTSGAQSALSALEQTLHPSPASSTSTGATSPTGGAQSSFIQELTALIKAVQAGDQTAAQQDLTQLQSTLQTQGSEGHHHHHRGGVDSATANVGNNTGSNSAGGTGASGGPISTTSASAYASMMDMQATSSAMSAFA